MPAEETTALHRSEAIVVGLVGGGVLGYLSLVVGPLGLGAALVVVVLTVRSPRYRSALGPLLLGVGLAGALLVLLPALLNTDPAVSYPVEANAAPGAGYAALALAGAVLFAWDLRHRVPSPR